jgi:hypothetical protein
VTCSVPFSQKIGECPLAEPSVWRLAERLCSLWIAHLIQILTGRCRRFDRRESLWKSSEFPCHLSRTRLAWRLEKKITLFKVGGALGNYCAIHRGHDRLGHCGKMILRASQFSLGSSIYRNMFKDLRAPHTRMRKYSEKSHAMVLVSRRLSGSLAERTTA